jgi:hypothetical protein
MADIADEIATYLTAMATISYLVAPWDDFNEGQKVLLSEYLDGTVDVEVDVDVDFYGRFGFIAESSLIRCYIDLEVYHEEAFGDLLDKAEETGKRYAELAFDFVEYGSDYQDLKGAVLNNWKSAADYVSRRIGIFA